MVSLLPTLLNENTIFRHTVSSGSSEIYQRELRDSHRALRMLRSSLASSAAIARITLQLEDSAMAATLSRLLLVAAANPALSEQHRGSLCALLQPLQRELDAIAAAEIETKRADDDDDAPPPAPVQSVEAQLVTDAASTIDFMTTLFDAEGGSSKRRSSHMGSVSDAYAAVDIGEIVGSPKQKKRRRR